MGEYGEVLEEGYKGCEELLGEVWRSVGGGVEKCVGTPHFSTPPPLFSTRPHTPTHFPPPSTLTACALPHLSHTSPPPNTFPHFFHIPPYLTQLPKLPKMSQFSHHPYSPKFSTLPRFFPKLPHIYFIIYPISRFLTFLIYCQNSIAIKYKRRIKSFENQDKKWQHNIIAS